VLQDHPEHFQLCAETEEGQRLRQNSPFAGVLSPAEVWEIKSRLRRHATTPT
jgi:CRISPR/Cas system-associated endoribonuclease Cas2